MYKYPENVCMSEAEYLKVEEAARERSEYVAGRMFAMTGATAGHNEIVSNLASILHPLAKKAGCKSYIANMKLKVAVLGNFYYPDFIISCENPDSKAMFLNAPRVIFEVLSPSTKSIDCREKLTAYKTIPSLKEYVIVHQDKKRVELNRKDENGDWQFHTYEGSSILQLRSVGSNVIDLDLDSIYDGLNL
jgi:Uma2 family endonuclease